MPKLSDEEIEAIDKALTKTWSMNRMESNRYQAKIRNNSYRWLTELVAEVKELREKAADPTPPVQPDTPTSGTEILLTHQAKEVAELIHKTLQCGINPGDRVRHTGQDSKAYGVGTVIDVGLTSSRVKWDNSNAISRPLTKLLEVIK